MSRTNSLLRKASILSISLAATIATISPIYNVSAATPNEITATYPYYGFVENPDDPWDSVYDALDEVGTVKYSDEYFETPSPGDHPKLRAVSYALALAGFENKADGYPSTTTIANPKLIDFLNQLGFSDYQSWDTSSEKDGQ